MNTLRTHGKCILAGEHSVVRGGEALVLPLLSRSLELRWQNAPATVWPDGPFGASFREALLTAAARAEFSLAERGYLFDLGSDIPVRAGLGSSAALSVALTHFLQREGARITDPFAFALEIENLFHGKSSGIDVAAVLAGHAIVYTRGTPPSPLKLTWQPHLYLSDTGVRSSTKECVAKVEAAKRPDLDERMREAVERAKAALALSQEEGPAALAAAMQMAASCFAEWGLGAEPELIRLLEQRGALAVKPTGSGGGGFLLSLWDKAPPAELSLIRVAADFSAAL